jgi:hypothetical protein
VASSVNCSTLNIDAICSFETSVHFQRITWRSTSEDTSKTLRNDHCENIKPYIKCMVRMRNCPLSYMRVFEPRQTRRGKCAPLRSIYVLQMCSFSDPVHTILTEHRAVITFVLLSLVKHRNIESQHSVELVLEFIFSFVYLPPCNNI